MGYCLSMCNNILAIYYDLFFIIIFIIIYFLCFFCHKCLYLTHFIDPNSIKDVYNANQCLYNRLSRTKGKQKTFKMRLVSPSGIRLLGYCLRQQKKLFFEL